jgi:CheY-like chemotaxis protein
MSLARAQPVIYMIDCQSAALTSMCPLLEASGHPVFKVADAELFSRDVLSRRTVRSCDAMIMDMDMGEPMTFRLLNLIMHIPDRPRIVLMASVDAVIGDQDSFPHEKLHILRHPATPQQLLDLLEANP